MQYDISDNELIYLYRCSNYDAFECLSIRYKKRIYGIIEKKSRIYNLKNLDFEDIYHSCYITFLKCIENFDEEHIFYSYLIEAIEFTLVRLLHKEKRKQEIKSLDNEIINKGFLLEDVINDSSYVYEENEIEEYFKKNLDELSQTIIEYRLKGYSYKEMISFLSISRKQIYNRVNKIKKRLKNGIYH